MDKSANVIHHGRVAGLAGALVVVTETVALEKQPQGHVIPAVKIHVYDPETPTRETVDQNIFSPQKVGFIF